MFEVLNNWVWQLRGSPAAALCSSSVKTNIGAGASWNSTNDLVTTQQIVQEADGAEYNGCLLT